MIPKSYGILQACRTKNMFPLFRSLKSRLRFTFLVFTILGILMAVISFLFYNRSSSLFAFSYFIDEMLIKTHRLIKSEQDFLYYETINANFFLTEKSKYLDEHKQLMKELSLALKNLSQSSKILGLQLDKERVSSNIRQLFKELQKYDQSFLQLVALTKERGFKDEGFMGEMRNYIHQVEADSALGISLKDIYLLRRHEKDYLIRKESIYILKLEQHHKKLKADILAKPDMDKSSKKNLVWRLDRYLETFNKIVSIESLMGLNNQSGKRSSMRKQADTTIILMEKLLREVNEEIAAMKGTQVSVFLVLCLIILILSFALSYVFAAMITKPVLQLTNAINHSVQNNFSDTEAALVEIHSKDEIGKMAKDFGFMLKAIQKSLQEIKDKNIQLGQQNEELNAVNLQLTKSEEKLSNLNTIKDKFFSIISHDLRSPLNSILGFLHILEKQADSFTEEEMEKFASEMLKSVHRVINLLENLLQWSLSQTGDLAYLPEDLNLEQIIAENIELYQNTAQEKDILLKAKISDDLIVKADKNMLSFIFRNLISNAIKFSYKGSEIRLSAKSNHQTVEVSISDQGVGIDKSSLEKLFLYDQHFTTSGTSLEKGTGFGLLLCKNFIEQNKGKMIIESEPGKGTVVKFTLEIAENKN